VSLTKSQQRLVHLPQDVVLLVLRQRQSRVVLGIYAADRYLRSENCTIVCLPIADSVKIRANPRSRTSLTTFGFEIPSNIALCRGSFILDICLTPSIISTSLSSKASTDIIAASISGCVATCKKNQICYLDLIHTHINFNYILRNEFTAKKNNFKTDENLEMICNLFKLIL